MVALALLAAGCGSQVSGPAPSPAVADGSRVDMCTVLTDVELSGLGIRLNTRQQVNRLGLVGCKWHGKPFLLGLERDKETVASYKARRHDPAFTSFADNMVNGRVAAHLSVDPNRTGRVRPQGCPARTAQRSRRPRRAERTVSCCRGPGSS